MSTSVTSKGAEYIDTADQAKLIRQALKKAFPGVKFSVRTSRYAGGSSVHVGWTDGPTSSQVEAVAGAYKGGGFDGMIDLAYSQETWLLPDGSVRFAATSGTEGSRGTVPAAVGSPMHPDARLVQFLGKYVSCQRRLSNDFRAILEAQVAEFAGEPYDHNRRYPISTYKRDDGTIGFAIDTHRGEYGSQLVHQLAAGTQKH